MISAGRPVALFAALEPEAHALTAELVPSTIGSPRLSIWEGALEGTQAVLVVTGVGKVAAALAAQFICDAFSPRCALVFGLAGAAANDGRRGQLIVASSALQHDMDARPYTDERGTIPSLGQATFPADQTLSKKLRQAAESVAGQPHMVTSGLVLTGDQIIASRRVKDALLKDYPRGACFDMETAAIAQVALQNGIPWAALRMTSDAADESFDLGEVMGFGVNTAAEVFNRIVHGFLKDL